MSRPLQSACFDVPLEVVSARNPITYNKKAADPVHPDLASLLVKNKTLLAELRNLQSKLFMKETSLQKIKTELESYKENNAQQSLQMMSLRDDIKNLQDLIASLMKIKVMKNTDSQNLGRGNWNLTERVVDLENHLRELLVEREKAEGKAQLLEKRWSCPSRCSPYVHSKGPEDSLDIFPVKDNGEAFNLERDNIVYSEGSIDGQNIGDKCQQDSIHKEKLTFEVGRLPSSCRWEATPEQAHHQNFLSQLATLLSDSIGPILATEEAVKERIRELGTNEQLWKSVEEENRVSLVVLEAPERGQSRSPALTPRTPVCQLCVPRQKMETLQQEIQTLTKRLEYLYRLYEEAAEENYMEQKRHLRHLEGKAPVNPSLRGLDMGRKKENSRTRTAHTDKHSKLAHLGVFLDIEQNSKMASAPRMEEKIQRLQKQLSDLKSSNKNMKTQLTRMNVLKDKTIERLRQSVTKVETVKEKTGAKTDNLKTTPDAAEQEARSEKEKAPRAAARGPVEPPTGRSPPKGVSGREQELTDFRETIMKMLGFNMKTADKEVINQLKLIIQVYEISKRSKTASHCESGQDK